MHEDDWREKYVFIVPVSYRLRVYGTENAIQHDWKRTSLNGIINEYLPFIMLM